MKETLARIDRMRSGSGRKLVNAAGRLINELRAHPRPHRVGRTDTQAAAECDNRQRAGPPYVPTAVTTAASGTATLHATEPAPVLSHEASAAVPADIAGYPAMGGEERRPKMETRASR